MHVHLEPRAAAPPWRQRLWLSIVLALVAPLAGSGCTASTSSPTTSAESADRHAERQRATSLAAAAEPRVQPDAGSTAQRRQEGHVASVQAEAEPETQPSPSAKADAEGVQPDAATTELARQSQNPVADLISLPLQNNTSFGVGPGNDVANVLNFQPVLPIRLNDDWNVINRVILPTIYAPEFVPGTGDEFGLGDVQYTAFLSPRDTGEFVWGVGPVFRFPTATDTRLGAGKWSVGPSIVGVYMKDRWVTGALAQHLFSYAGDSDRREVSELLLQPFVNYNLDDGWYLVSAPIVTANWMAPSGQRWTVPIGGGFGRVFRIGKQPVNASLQGYYNLEAPDAAGDWTLRFQLTFLFPKR